MADELPLGTCYGSGSIVGAIIGTLLITLALVSAGALLYNIYWRSRKGKHLVLVTDVENPDDQYAFDNPNFREATPIKQSPSGEKTGKLDLSWFSGWSPLHVFSTPRNEKRSLDDSFITDSQLKVVSLKSHDFTGLGFSVCGNMRDGIFVKDLLHRGPAFESGCINPGDRIDSVCISFRHMVFEDALTILSYASPYEVQVQVEHNTTSRPSTLLRKRETNHSTERILHPFYRSQSISDLTTFGKNSGRRSNTTERTKCNKQGDSLMSGDYPTLKLPTVDLKKEHQSLERHSVDTTDSTEPPKHAKFGIKVLPLPVNLHIRNKDHQIDNEQNIAIECDLETDRIKPDEDVKTTLTKKFQNLKEKINQNTLGRKKKDEQPASVVEEAGIPEEVARAGAMAQNNRKSVSAESLAARKSITDILPLDSDTSSEGRSKKTKGKAPAPPQGATTPEPEPKIDTTVTTVTVSETRVIFEPLQPDSDSEVEGVETTCTQATVHHSPVTEEPDSGRKAASLGDLSHIEDESPCPFERAVSLDMDASHGKKRKAPPPPEDFPGAFEETYRKEPRLEAIATTFQQRLKKSSDFGTLEDALQDSDPEESAEDFTSTVATNIQEFSSWLEEVRKPQSENSTDHHLTLNVNGNGNLDEIETGKNAWDISTDSDILYTSALSTDIPSTTNTSTIDLIVDSGKIVKDVLSVTDVTQEMPTSEEPISMVTSPQPGFTFSVNGLNLQEASRTVLLISQPNSLDPEDVPVAEDETPPQLPTSPPPSTSLTYITEIRVATPEPDREREAATAPSPSQSPVAITTPPRAKPQRKDLSPEVSRIPVRTMKSETGQKVLAAIQSLAAKEIGQPNEDSTPPSVAGFHLKKVPPVVPPRRNDSLWAEGIAKDRINGTPMHHMPTGVSLPVKTSATKIVFESQENNEEF